MKILKWQLAEVVLPPFDEVQAQQVLVVTDCVEVEADAQHMGVASLRLDRFLDAEAMRVEMELTGVTYDVIVVVSGRLQSLVSLTREKWMTYSRCCLGLLRWVFGQNRQMRLLSFYSHPNVLAAIFDGLARSASLEMPRVSFTSVQIPSGFIKDGLREWIGKSLLWPSARLQFEGCRLLRRTLVATGQRIVKDVLFQKGDNIILIGGTGGIGSELCRFLQAKPDRNPNVFVLGRKMLDATLNQALKEHGVKSYFRIDAADYSALEAVFSHIRQTFGPIKAVFNLVGILDDCLFHNLTADRLENVLHPKVSVVLNLTELVKDYRPQYVVNFSSLTATIGNIGQSAYAAANEFIERVSEQIPNWYSFAWGLWSSRGMQMGQGESGLLAMSPLAACESMMSALAGGERHLVIYDGEADGVTALCVNGTIPTPQVTATASSVTQLADDDVDALRVPTRRWLKDIVCRHSGLKAVNDVDNLLDKGIDSVGSIQISTDITAQLSPQGNFKLSRAILFECPTIAQLAEFLIQQAEPLLRAYLPQYATMDNAFVESLRSLNDAATRVVEPQVPKSDSSIPSASSEVNQRLLSNIYRDDDIAIIGVAGEFPNGATLETFWASLQNGEDAITVIPEQRWNWRHDYTATLARIDKSYGRHGGFIDGAYEFDPAFFNIAPVDAELLDPQERRFLQVSYHALEDSGYFIAPTPNMGVFAAAMFGHYQDLNTSERVISSSFAAIANRVSYAFDLQGPSLTVDTMCSGSLTALHMACNSLRLGECEVALAGGANIMSHPGKYRLLSQGKFLSAGGHCYAFGVEADGYVPGEGVAVVVLKSVADAIREQDNIYAIVRATAINSGGRTSSFTVPSARAQQSVIQTALNRSGVNPRDVNYIEAHGTGTSLGDPIELQALQKAYGENRDVPCYLGSVKSNIGHLESVAAMAGLFKVIQQFAHERLAPTLHCAIENPYLNIEQTRFQLVKNSQHWPMSDSVTRYAGLSSFGAGGANGHAILQQYIPLHVEVEAPLLEEYLIPLSAPNHSGLQRVKQQLADYLSANPDVCPYALSYTLCCARQHHVERLCYVVHSVEELLSELASGSTSTSNNVSTQAFTDSQFVYADRVRDYLLRNTSSFADLFPVKKRLRLPHYPFARNLYWASSLRPGRETLAQPKPSLVTTVATKKINAEGNAKPLLLEPVWYQKEQTFPVKRLPLVVIMAQPEQKLPLHIGGTKVLRISPSTNLQIMDGHIQLCPENKADFERVLNYLMEELHQEQVYWINLNIHWTSVSALALAKAMQSFQHPCSLLCVNDGKQVLENIAMGSVFRVLALENSLIGFAQVHMEGDATTYVSADWEWVLAELGDVRQGYKEVRRQDRQRKERALDSLTLMEGARLRDGGVYLIAGGMGMIGKEIAWHLHAHYNAKVILVGRSSLSPQKLAWLQQWQKESGGVLCYMQADIANLTETERLVENVLHQFGRLDGVVQSAGVIKDALVQNKSLADFESVMAVKIQGTCNLDRCTADLNLDFFCLFSSISSVMGNVGQCDYVAANRFLDEFAVLRNQQVSEGVRQGHTLSINWPLWLDNHNADRYRALADYLHRQYGLVPLTLSQGAELFISWINGVPERCSQIMGLLGDREKIIERLILTGPGASSKATASALVSTMQQTASVAQIRQGLTRITQALAQLAEEDISAEKSWGDLGFNSVMMQTLAQAIGNEFGTLVPPNALFTYSNISRMSEYLEQQGATFNQSEVAINTAQTETAQEKSAVTVLAAQTNRENVTQPERHFAIVGMSGVMPGAKDIDEFWELLMQNRTAIRRVERWRDKTYYAGTIDDIDKFDARFFGLSAREAMLMDPQHRLFLQTSYNALMDAGYAPSALTNVGVFAGVQFTDYQTLLQSWGQSSHPYAATGNAHAILANRVSYLLNFSGPSQTIDTACSSALVAVNRGLMSLQNNECDIALVGAVSLLLDPVISDAAKSMGVLSPDSRCATFDEKANGYVRAEGVGCVVIKRLTDALQDGDSIYGVIESSAENHGGRANSLTAPNPQAQAALLQKAYTVQLADRVSYIETHGTGTKLGDPIEIDALQQAFKALVPAKQEGSIALGAVKSNIGHLEPAAGMASLLKVLLCLKHRFLPANINFSKQNPMIHLNGSPFQLLTQNRPWTSSGTRVAGISCFGFGGSNAHVVISEAPAARSLNRINRPSWLITLSAKTSYSLESMRRQLLAYLQESSDELADIAFTLACGRESFAYRMSWITDSVENLIAQVRASEKSVVEKCRLTQEVWASTLSEITSNVEWENLLQELQERFQQGSIIDWECLYQPSKYRRLHLPGYVFDTKTYWFEQASSSTVMKEVNHGS